jgi:Cell division protein CrgA
MAAAGAAVTGVALGSAAKVVSGASGATGAVADALKKPKTGGPNASKGPGRFTPKGSTPAKPGGKKSDSSGEKLPAYASSGRYTAPAEKVAAEEAAFLPTRPWIPWVMFALLAIGGLLIVLNYVGVWPNAPSNWYLLGGIVAITGGFITATQLR